MKKIFVAIVVIVSLSPVTSSFAFLDYLFSGSSSRDAIDNSAVGDLRAWWTGNPAYTFNPYYSGAGMPQGQQQPGQAPQVAQPQLQQQPIINYYPPSQGGASYPYAQQQAPAQQVPQQQMQYGYGQPQQPYQPQGMQPPVQYQAAPQAYQYQQANPQQ